MFLLKIPDIIYVIPDIRFNNKCVHLLKSF